jgi:nucleoside-diphosphate-sugar epimerase
METEARPEALVTGVAGFLGSHLAEALLDRGHAVRGVDCFTPYYGRSLKEANLAGLRSRPGFRFHETDLRSADLSPLVDGVDWIFHQAAQPGVRASWDEGFADYVGHNLLGTQRLLETCRRAGSARVVFASSSSVYGNVPEGEVTEDAPLRPISPYGVTKLGSERLVDVYHREFGLHTVSLRYFTICGPRQRPDMAFHKILRALHLEQEFPQYGDGSQLRDFTYVEDAVRANLLAAERGEAGGVYNIGGGNPVSLGHAIRILERVTGRRARIRVLPRAEGDPDRTAASLERARRDLGYDPEVRVEEALQREAEWFAGPEGPLAVEAGRRS